MALPTVTPAAVLPAPAAAGAAPHLAPGKAPILTPLPFCSTVRTADGAFAHVPLCQGQRCAACFRVVPNLLTKPLGTPSISTRWQNLTLGQCTTSPGALSGRRVDAVLVPKHKPASILVSKRGVSVIPDAPSLFLPQTDRHGLFGMDTEAKRPLTALMAGTPLAFGGLFTAERPATGGSAATGFTWHVRETWPPEAFCSAMRLAPCSAMRLAPCYAFCRR